MSHSAPKSRMRTKITDTVYLSKQHDNCFYRTMRKYKLTSSKGEKNNGQFDTQNRKPSIIPLKSTFFPLFCKEIGEIKYL